MRMFFKNAISVSRLNNGVTTSEYQSNGTIYGVIVGLSPSEAMLSEGNPSQSAILYTEKNSDLKVGDRIICNSETYIVRGIKEPEQFFTLGYKRAIVEKLKS